MSLKRDRWLADVDRYQRENNRAAAAHRKGVIRMWDAVPGAWEHMDAADTLPPMTGGFQECACDAESRVCSCSAFTRTKVDAMDAMDATEIARNEMIAARRVMAYTPSSNIAPSYSARAAKMDAVDNDPDRARAEMIRRHRDMCRVGT